MSVLDDSPNDQQTDIVDPASPPADPSPAADPGAPSGDPSAPAADPAAAADDGPKGFAEDWRQQIAGEDEKWLNQLNRYQSPKALAEALREAQKKISAGQAKTLPDNPTEEQLAEWREQQGIPKDATGYDLDLGDGLVIGDEDKPMVDEFLKAMHGTNATPEQVKAGLSAYYTMQQQQIQRLEEQDNTDKETALQSLRDEWGPDFQSNRNALKSLVNQIPEAAREGFLNARLADGTALLNSPEMVMFLADISRKTNPAATVVPNSNNPSQAISDEIAKIEKTMQTDPNSYWKDPAMQKRYAELLGAQG